MRAQCEEINPGDFIGGRYEIVERIDGGGMGSVYAAVDRHLEKPVAIKVLSAELATKSASRRRFQREARIASQVRHDNVCAVTDYGVTDDDRPYLVMERIEGELLKDRLRREKVLEPALAVEIAIQLLEALAAVHAAGIVHRDLKPSNIFLVRDRRLAVRIKLLDFGVAQVPSDTRLTEEGKVLGTPHFMSPEQVLGQEVDHRSDLWAVGVLLFTMLTGRKPFNGNSVISVLSSIAFDDFPSIAALPSIPARLNEIVERATAREASERYSSALGFAYDLEMMAAELGPARGQRVSSTPPPIDAAEYWEQWTEGAIAGDAVEPLPERRAATPPPPLETTTPTINEGLRGRSAG